MVVIAPAVLRAGHLWIERFLIFSKNGTAHFFSVPFFPENAKAGTAWLYFYEM